MEPDVERGWWAAWRDEYPNPSRAASPGYCLRRATSLGAARRCRGLCRGVRVMFLATE